MFTKRLHIFMILLILVTFVSSKGWAQGVTTAAMSGVVTDSNGEPLPGATVLAIHTPSGTQYGTATLPSGRYNFPNVRVGGPYTVTASFVGYRDEKKEGVNLQLGQSLTLNFVLASADVQLEEVEITATKDDVINSDRTGAATNISREQVQSLPTIQRGIYDFARLTPQANLTSAGGISIAGMNNRYNQLSIDGAVSNDVFGLAESGVNGGQTGIQPISLDAIEQIQVVIAPYDVRQGGFAGGGINAVTRSGTNEFSGSAYYFTRNEKFAGKTPTDDPVVVRERFSDFTDYQTGFRLGGPIIKNKLFFFVNGEITRRFEPLQAVPGTSDSNITIAQADSVRTKLLSYGYDPGAFRDINRETNSNKLFARIDWSINKKHNLTLRHSYTFGEAIRISRFANTLTFENGAEYFPSTTNSSVLEVNSSFSNALSNNLIIGFTRVRDDRDPNGAAFPWVSIDLGSRNSIRAGSEEFSTANQLDQDVLTITDNLNIYKGKHTITLGTHNEYYSIYNLFIRQNYGSYRFRNLQDFYAGLADNFSYSYSLTDNPKEGADFGALQLGFYAQDEIAILPNLKITGGLRVDVPIFLDEPKENTDFNNSTLAQQYNVKNNEMPDPQLMFSPRVGFNYDVQGNRVTQLRGGVGIFTSRLPYVWAGGAYTQNGILLGSNNITIDRKDPASIPFNPDPFNQPKANVAAGPQGEINVFDKNFKFPQVFRANVAVDQRLPLGLIGSAELLYTKTINNVNFTNINLKAPVSTLQGADNRPLYNSRDKILTNYNEIIYVSNTNLGYTYSGTVQLQRPFQNGLYSSLAYTYTRATELNAGTSSQNVSNWTFIENVNGLNNLSLSTSDFEIRHRIVGAVSYRKEYLNKLGTTISLFYTGQSGRPFSYIYRDDLNKETIRSDRSNDLIYVPANASEIVFVQNGDLSPQQQWDAYNNFIENNNYLSTRRGKYAERNGARLPFTHQFDVKIVQDIFTNIGDKRNTLQLTLDIFNVGNLLNKNWGRQYIMNFDNFSLLRFQGFQEGTTIPTFTYDPVEGEPSDVLDTITGGSRWIAQFGVRYIFN